MKQIFPKEIIDNTVEVHRFKHSLKSKIIYGIVLLSIIGIGASLPFVFLDIYSSAKGILKSEEERNLISSFYSGKITSTFIKENKYVQQGDTLLIIDNTIGKEKLNLVSNQLEETNLFISDLAYLSNTKKLSQDSLHSFLYQKQYLQYAQKLLELQTRYKKSNQFKEQQRNQWQAELTSQNNKSKELNSTLSQYKNEQENHIITASISGTIQNIKGFEVGNFITSGTPIAEISPDTELIAECYISPSDIGLLKIDSKVKYQINAFNYNQWGMATGEIKTIGKDIVMINNIPMFKVICSLDQKQLQLKNGFEGKLKKGMTLNARFFIINRSVFDLLYDKVDDWFNPSKLDN